MRKYCEETLCLHKYLMNYFGFQIKTQSRCCCNCSLEEISKENVNDLKVKNNNSFTHADNELYEELLMLCNHNYESTGPSFVPFKFVFNANIVEDIINNLSEVNSEKDLLQTFGVWDENICANIYNVICKHRNLKATSRL